MSAPQSGTSARRFSRAWFRSARSSTRSSPVFSPQAPSRDWVTRSSFTRCRSACSACRSGGRATRDVRRRRPRRARSPARSTEQWSSSDSLFCRAVGGKVPGARRRYRRSPVQTGWFTRPDTVLVWWILAGSAVGLLASTLGRLYSSTYYAMRDTRTPLRYAVIRVILTTVLGYLSALVLPPIFGVPPLLGTAGLTASDRRGGMG